MNKEKDRVAAFFGEIHPNIIKKIDIKTESLIGFEVFIDNLKLSKKSLNDQKANLLLQSIRSQSEILLF